MITATKTQEELVPNLLELRQKLAAYRTLSCQLVHEHVMDFITDPIPEDMDLSEVLVKRRGFCTPALRKTTLGCAHTLANEHFSRLADAVHATGILGDATLPSIDLTNIIVRIYKMDHEKGALEKRFAFAERNGNIPEMESVRAMISELLTRHAAYIDELEEYRKQLFNRIDEQINAG